MQVLMQRRTESEIKAYIDGYNACYRHFCESLKKENYDVQKTSEMMLIYKTDVNAVLDTDVEQ